VFSSSRATSRLSHALRWIANLWYSRSSPRIVSISSCVLSKPTCLRYDALVYTTDGFVPEALVTIQESNATHLLRDTTFARSDTSRYKFPLRAYVVNPLAISYGGLYRVTVQSPGFEDASTSVIVPRRPALSMPPVSIRLCSRPTPSKTTMKSCSQLTWGWSEGLDRAVLHLLQRLPEWYMG